MAHVQMFMDDISVFSLHVGNSQKSYTVHFLDFEPNSITRGLYLLLYPFKIFTLIYLTVW
jgi:hypothetical protein